MMLNIKNARIRTRYHQLAAMIAKVEQGEQIIIHRKGSRRLIVQTDQFAGKGPPHRPQTCPINRANHRGMLSRRGNDALKWFHASGSDEESGSWVTARQKRCWEPLAGIDTAWRQPEQIDGGTVTALHLINQIARCALARSHPTPRQSRSRSIGGDFGPPKRMVCVNGGRACYLRWSSPPLFTVTENFSLCIHRLYRAFACSPYPGSP